MVACRLHKSARALETSRPKFQYFTWINTIQVLLFGQSADSHHISGALISKSATWLWRSRPRPFIFKVFSHIQGVFSMSWFMSGVNRKKTESICFKVTAQTNIKHRVQLSVTTPNDIEGQVHSYSIGIFSMSWYITGMNLATMYWFVERLLCRQASCRSTKYKITLTVKVKVFHIEWGY